MSTINKTLGKVMYGILFIIILPFLLWLWSIQLNSIVHLPAIHSNWGISFMILGLVLLVWSMFMLVIHGEGLPMNAFPTKKLVRSGPYCVFKHPIYIGFGIFLIGSSIWIGLASALWIVTPITILGMIALVWGYEKINLEDKFPEYRKPVFFSIPKNGILPASIQQKIISVVIFYSILLLGNFIILFLYSNTSGSIEIIDFENIPYFMPIIGIATVVLPLIIIFLSITQTILREWIVSSFIALGLTYYLAIIWPEIGAHYFIVADSNFVLNIQLLNLITIPGCLLLVLVGTFAQLAGKLKWIIWLFGYMLVLILVTVSTAPLVNLFTTIFIFLIAFNWKRIWLFLRNHTEKIANSWKEWLIGPVRIINHGFYIGILAFLATLVGGFMIGKEYIWGIVVFLFIVLVFAALWAQLIEGSEKLKRPFGYYGALVGMIIASLSVWALGYNVWVIIGVISVLIPWCQAIGRLRCLVNGCCHGSKVSSKEIGIKYVHPRSRVCGISGLKGENLHPTQLYAIIWLFFVGFLLLSLWLSESSSVFILGMYLIFTGLGRFVEEAYRGEVQTPFFFGLRLYQWMAILSIVIGTVCTTLKITEVQLTPTFGPSIFIGAALIGLFSFFAMGVDFPKSNMRFSRLV